MIAACSIYGCFSWRACSSISRADLEKLPLEVRVISSYSKSVRQTRPIRSWQSAAFFFGAPMLNLLWLRLSGGQEFGAARLGAKKMPAVKD